MYAKLGLRGSVAEALVTSWLELAVEAVAVGEKQKKTIAINIDNPVIIDTVARSTRKRLEALLL